jgi:ubiquitin-conjugating enzyme E2 M
MRDLEESDAVKFCHPDPANLRVLKVTIKPDRSSWWSPGVYEFTVTVGDEYPHKAPVAHCNTQVYHPNIDMEGHVCLNILRAEWNPVLSLYAVLNGLLFLFYEPNPLDPLNHGPCRCCVGSVVVCVLHCRACVCGLLSAPAEAAALLRSDVDAFKRKVALSLRGGTIDGRPFPRFT